MSPEHTTLSDLLAYAQVDQAHARQVADLALALFDGVAEQFALPAEQRRLLESGALLHNLGLTIDPPAHHLVGRDLALRWRIAGLSRREQTMVACMIAFHRKKVRPRLEPTYLALGRKEQQRALQLAAILRVADGLDQSQSQQTRLLNVVRETEGVVLQLSGPFAAMDGARAVAKADLWTKVFGVPVHAVVVDHADGEPDESGPEAYEAAAEADDEPIIAPWFADPQVPLAELGRVLLRRHLRRLMLAERDVKAKQQAEAVHALRVATRRLRATIRLLEPVAAVPNLRALRKGLTQLAGAASAVRDRDVLLADLALRSPELPNAVQPGLAQLIATLQAERVGLDGALQSYLDGPGHSEWLQSFAAAMNDLRYWDNQPRLCDLGGSTLWQHYEALRSHARDGIPEDETELHALRIAGKRLRYVLELFTDALGTQVDEAVAPLIAFQDHLGLINDSVVARGLLEELAHDPTLEPVIEAYLALRGRQAEQLRSKLPARWAELTDETYRRQLMELVIRL